MNRTIFGPTCTEMAYALYVAMAADEFLDAYLSGKIEPRHVRNLAIQLSDLVDNCMVIDKSGLQNRADDLLEEDWKKAKFSRPVMRLTMDIPLGPDESELDAPPVPV